MARQTTGLLFQPSAPKLIQLQFSKYFTVNALNTEHTKSTEDDLRHLLFLVFSVASVCSVVNAMADRD
ncbi:hypothetical protein I41_29560 [Lacipirellula limnantheis]|uniref:Uncharacterized protein n=1 Tax=Lacipirellula limnantheis TaxID=2528024 RepID=A0A517TZH7_9BACT|nr:hypothetical protein I41_29560 [Lacipirellula limnantheis]